MSEQVEWPVKTREMHNHHFDSTIWNDFRFRNDDIIIATYAKAGTTWMQQIVAQLLLGDDPELTVAEMSPWMDLRVPPKEVKLASVESQTHRSFPEYPNRRDQLVGHSRVLFFRVDEGERNQERAIGRSVLGCGRASLHQPRHQWSLVGNLVGRRIEPIPATG